MQLVNLVIVTLIWIPFLKLLDKRYFSEELVGAGKEVAAGKDK